MRTTIMLVIGVLCLHTNAQNINDVLRYGLEETQGTARFQAMGGAFGALGGDLSALSLNPASAAVFKYSQIGITGSVYSRDHNAYYGNGFTNSSEGFTEINQGGGVFVFKTTESPWKKLAFGVNYDLVDNYDDDIRIQGTTRSGIDQHFLGFSQGQSLGPLRVGANEGVDDAYLDIGANLGFGAQQAFLGFQAGITEPVDDVDENTEYFSNALYNTVDQRYAEETRGYNGKLTLNFAAQYEDNLYLGAALNFHTVYLERLTFLDESGFDADSDVQSVSFDNFLVTEGNGFSFSLGGIARVAENLRLGASYQSPTWYEFRDDLSQRISANAVNANPNLREVNFSLVNLFPDYDIRIPSKFTGSAALVFAKTGLISFDYGYQDFSNAELRPTSDPAFADENSFISNQLGAVNTYRVGGEYRVEQLSLRAGYRLEESPYEDETLISDLNAYSAGIGYDFGNSKLDFAFVRTDQDVSRAVLNGGNNNVHVNTDINNYTLTYTLKF